MHSRAAFLTRQDKNATIRAMVETSPSVTPLYAQAILQAAERRGLSLPAAIRDQVQPRKRVPLALQDQLWEHYCRLVDDPLAGLEMGLALEIGHLDSAGMLLVSCDTLQDGFEALLEYAPIIGDGGAFSFHTQAEWMFLSYRPAYQVRARERVEAVMASLLKFTRWATGDVFQAQSLQFAHHALVAPALYQQRLAIPLVFAADSNSLCFHHSQANLPLIQANSSLRVHLQQLADQTLERLGQQSLSAQVTQCVRMHPEWGRERVASALALSGRHMNRLLAAEGLSFKVLKERELHRMALALLQSGRSVGHTAAQLGFSEESALVRAFRRWQGETPIRYRERYLSTTE